VTGRKPRTARSAGLILVLWAVCGAGAPAARAEASGRSCGIQRSRALFRDTVATFAQRHHLAPAAFRTLNGLQGAPPSAALVHRRAYVTASGSVGEKLGAGHSMGPTTPDYVVRNPNRAWGQPFVVDLLQLAARTVQQRHPAGHRVVFEDLSFEHGGCMVPHIEHRGGLEVDVGFYHQGMDPQGRLKMATTGNLDVRRTLLFLRVLLESGRVDRVLVDRRILAQLRSRALADGVDQATLAQWFSTGSSAPAITRHAAGHGGHFHIRFSCPAPGCGDRGEVSGEPCMVKPDLWTRPQ
jgi:murein endopeptidase